MGIENNFERNARGFFGIRTLKGDFNLSITITIPKEIRQQVELLDGTNFTEDLYEYFFMNEEEDLQKIIHSKTKNEM